MKTNNILWVLIVFCALGLSAADDFGIENLQADQAADVQSGGPDYMDSRLFRLVTIRERQGEDAARQYAERFAIPYDPQTGVRIELIAADHGSQLPLASLRQMERNLRMTLLSNQVRSVGGQVLHRFGLNLSCRVPLDQVMALSAYAAMVHLPFPLHPHVVSEGVAAMNSQQLANLSPFRAQGVHVCVMDIGFENHQQLVGSELPDDFTVQTVRNDGRTDDGYHGTGCAEIVHDVAPDARITGLATLYVSDIFPAANWILNNDVDVVSASIGHYYSPGDGTGYEDEMAKEMKKQGIVYVTSAGNEGNDHWSGTFNDPDGDGWHNFAGQDEMLTFYVPAFSTVNNLLRWDDWGVWNSDTMQWAGASQDYDLYLYYRNPNTGKWIQLSDASSFNRQPGYRFPIEEAGGYYYGSATYWGVSIRAHKASRKVRFDLFVFTHGAMEYSNPAGSIGIPGDSTNIIAVGACDALTDELHDYSSQGPTLDGRIKPDVCAPAGVSTSDLTFGSRGFYGTSAACPHMAGLFALFKSRTPFSPDQIVSTIYARVLDLGAAGLDNLFGRGRIRVGSE